MPRGPSADCAAVHGTVAAHVRLNVPRNPCSASMIAAAARCVCWVFRAGKGGAIPVTFLTLSPEIWWLTSVGADAKGGNHRKDGVRGRC